MLEKGEEGREKGKPPRSPTLPPYPFPLPNKEWQNAQT